MTDFLPEYEGYDTRDWDGYDADPITPATLACARVLAAMLADLPVQVDPAPGADGTIGFEIRWPDGGKLWLDVGPGEKIEGYIPQRGRAHK